MEDKDTSEYSVPLSPPPTSPEPPVFKTEVEGEKGAPETEVTPEELAPESLSASSAPPFMPEPEIPPAVEGKKTTFLIIGGAALLFIIIFFVVLSILGGVFNAKSEKITLDYWGLWEDESVYSSLIADYERKNPNINIKYSQREPVNYREKLVARSRQGNGPDLFRYHNTWLTQIKEVVAPLPEAVISKEEFDNTFYPIAKSDLKIDQAYYGIPLEIDGLVLIYNNSLFKQVGIELAPKTWDDIVDYAGKLTVKDTNGQIITSGIALGTADNIEHSSDILGMMLLQNGADLRKLTSSEAVETLEAYRRFAEPPDNSWDENMPNSIAAFVQEKVAMIFVPSWQIITIKEASPDLDIKAVPVPKVPGGREVTIATYWVEGVSKYSKHQLEAWKFLKYLSEKENMTKLYTQQARLRLFGEPYSRVDLQSAGLQNEYIAAVVSQARNMKSLSLNSRTHDNGLNDQIARYLNEAINATIQGVSYAEAFATAHRGVSQVFEKFASK